MNLAGYRIGLKLRRVARRCCSVAILGACLLSIAGCGGSDQIAVHPVSGKVLVEGQPAAGATVVFYATDIEIRGPHTPIPKAEVQPDGSFRLTSFGEGDGAPLGTYNVTIEWREPIPEGVNREMHTPRDRLGGKYANPEQSGLEATVAEGANVLEPFALK